MPDMNEIEGLRAELRLEARASRANQRLQGLRLINGLLDRAKAKLMEQEQRDISDRELGSILGLQATMVSQYRTGRSFPGPETMQHLADLAQEPREQALIDLQICKATSDGERVTWERIRQRVVGSAAGVLLVLASLGPAASENKALTDCTELPRLYIMRSFAGWLRWLTASLNRRVPA